MKIPFLALKANYNSIKEEITPAIQNVLDNTAYVPGKSVFVCKPTDYIYDNTIVFNYQKEKQNAYN